MAGTCFDLQPRIHNELIRLEPLQPEDFESLYAVAADPLIWDQHPNKNRYQRDVFANFFKGALESRGASCVLDQTTGELIGSSRFYALDQPHSVVSIGYTFIARSTWGRQYNRALKRLMLDHAFRYVERVVFQVGIDNKRSRRAMEKLGGVYLKTELVSYYGEPSHENVIYKIDKADWLNSLKAP